MNKKKISEALEEFKETHINESFRNLNFTIILVQPENAGNIGSVARLMKNFNFERLVIFNPIESIGAIKNYTTQGYAMHGKDILLNAEIVEVPNQRDHDREFSNFVSNFDLILGTTAKGKRFTNVRRIAIFPKEIQLPPSEKPKSIALLFGKESRGLTNFEVDLCDILIRIPTSNHYSTLNLSHACGIILFEIFKKIHIINIGRGANPILLSDKSDRIILYDFFERICQKIKVRNYKKNMTLDAFKNIFERAMTTKKEINLVLGVFSKLDGLLQDKEFF